MLNAQLHVEASSEALLQRCTRLLSHTSYDRQPVQPSTPHMRGHSVRQERRQYTSDFAHVRSESGRYASTSRGISPLHAASPEASAEPGEQPEGPRDDDVRCRVVHVLNVHLQANT